MLRSTADGDFVKLIGELLNMGPSELSPGELAEVAHLEKVAGRLAEAEQHARDAEPYTGLADVVEFYKRRKIELKKAASEDLVSVPPRHAAWWPAASWQGRFGWGTRARGRQGPGEMGSQVSVAA